MVPITPLAVEYTVHGTVKPESSLIRCQMDVLYRNLSADTLRALYIRLPARLTAAGASGSRSTCHIDSILMFGVPTLPDSVSSDSALLRIRFTRPLGPEGTIPFLVSFETSSENLNKSLGNKGTMVVCDRWMPEVCALEDGHWILPHAGNEDVPAECGEYNVALTIDSSFTIAAPGELLNERELYGFLPPAGADTVLVDVAGPRGKAAGPLGYKPVFTNGMKTYAWRLRYGSSFPVVVGQSVAVDRIASKGLTLETYYGRKSAKLQGTLIRQAANLVAKVEKLLGPCPRQKLVITQADVKQPRALSSGIILMPAHENKTSGLLVALAIDMARIWLPDILPDAEGRDGLLADGIAAYVGYSLVDDSELSFDYLKSMRLDGKGTASENYRGWEKFITIPSWLHILSKTTSDSVVWSGIRNFCSEYQTANASRAEFQRTLRAAAAGDLNWWYKLRDRSLVSIDYSLTKVACHPAKDSFVTAATIVRGNSPAVPLEIGYITTDSDTLFERVTYRDMDSAAGTYTVQYVSKLSVKAVVLDPHQWLPDSNRGNNCVPIDKGYRCRSIIPSFPPFRFIDGR